MKFSYSSTAFDPQAGVQRSQTYEGFMPIYNFLLRFYAIFVKITLEPITPSYSGYTRRVFSKFTIEDWV